MLLLLLTLLIINVNFYSQYEKDKKKVKMNLFIKKYILSKIKRIKILNSMIFNVEIKIIKKKKIMIMQL